MNNHMYEHPATQANLATLRERGVAVDRARRRRARRPRARRASGACAEPRRRSLRGASRRARCAGAAAAHLDGLRVLVTAGGTREPIDSVRFVGNRSSGRMGFALAEEAARARRATSP